MSNQSYKLATVDDALKLSVISSAIFKETFAAQNTKENLLTYIEENFNNEVLEVELADDQNKFIVFYDQTVPIGYIKLRSNSNHPKLKGLDAMEIQRLYLKKEYHGTGVGHVMMNVCLSIAKDEKVQVIWLGVWEHNLRAISFYRKFGFETFGTQIFMMATEAQTDLVMKLEFSSLKKV